MQVSFYMLNHTNLPKALFHALRRKLFATLVEDYSGTEPLKMKKCTVLVFGLLLSQKVRNFKDFRIGVALPPGVGAILGNLAILFAGKVPVNLNLTVSRQSMDVTLREADINVIISSEKVRQKFSDIPWTENLIDISEMLEIERSRKFLVLSTALKVLFLPQSVMRKFRVDQIEDNRKEAILLFTSGSSSQPKGVVLSDQNILSSCEQINSLGVFRKNMIILCNLPLFHSFGLTVGTFFPLLYGMRIVSSPSALDYRTSLRAIRQGKAEVILGTPTFLRGYLRKTGRDDFKWVRYVVAGAEKSPEDFIRIWEDQYDCEYLEGYGLTETSPGLSFSLPGSGKRAGSVGKLMKDIQVRIIDPETGAILKDNESGILCFRGPNVFQGYLNNPEKTREVFSEDGWFITGDLGRMDEDGFLYIEGRISRFSKIGGEMVSHQSMEEKVSQILGVNHKATGNLSFAITGIKDDAKGESLVLFTTTDIDLNWVAKELRAQGIPNLWIPKKIMKVDEIPLLGTGKLDLKKIADLAVEF